MSMMLRRGMLLADSQSGRLPAAYQEVEWLESVNTPVRGQYIDTGYVPNANTVWNFRWLFPGFLTISGILYAARMGRNGSGQRLSFTSNFKDNDSHTIELAMSNYIEEKYAYNTENIIFDIELDVPQKKGIVRKGSEIVYNKSFNPQNWTNLQTLWLFARNVGDNNYLQYDCGATDQRIYFSVISEQGAIVQNLIPCYRKSDSKPGMYDLVNDVFYTNQGAGEFTVGPNVN